MFEVLLNYKLPQCPHTIDWLTDSPVSPGEPHGQQRALLYLMVSMTKIYQSGHKILRIK
jgi:hypothetical protein